MMLVNLQVSAWARATLHNAHHKVADISAYVDDRVIRSPSWVTLKEMLDRTILVDRLSGQFLNFDKSSGLSTTFKGIKKLKLLRVDDKPLLIVKNAKSLGALVTTAMTPSSFIVSKRCDTALDSVKNSASTY